MSRIVVFMTSARAVDLRFSSWSCSKTRRSRRGCKKGAPPTHDVARIAGEVADALDKAHRRVHHPSRSELGERRRKPAFFVETMMLTPDALTRQWFDEVWNQGREEAIDRLLAADARLHGMGPVELTGPADFKKMWRTYRAAFADLTITVERTIVSGDLCVAQCRVRGRHVGDALGGPASGREVEIEGVTITRTNGTHAVEGWDYFDFLSLYQQIGWVPAPVLPPANPHT